MRSGTMPERSMPRSSRRSTAAGRKPAEEYEKFLFYRGLGEARLPLRIQEKRPREP